MCLLCWVCGTSCCRRSCHAQTGPNHGNGQDENYDQLSDGSGDIIRNMNAALEQLEDNGFLNMRDDNPLNPNQGQPNDTKRRFFAEDKIFNFLPFFEK
jgi:hypothetical protein